MTIATLQKFFPLNKLDEQQLRSLSEQARLVDVHEGKIIFKRNDLNETSHWLVSGAVDLLDADFKVTKLKADTDQSRLMLDAANPHHLTAITTNESRLLILEHETLLQSLKAAGIDELDNISADTHLADEEDSIDWMSALLESHLFELVPPANIQELFNRFKEVNLEPGDKVIVEGDTGDYFYVLKKGRVRIDKINGENTVKLAEAGPGDFFGEDALVRDAPRNATITMLTYGSLMRLGKDDFQGLLQQPTNEYISLEEIKDAKASAQLKLIVLDVRDPAEFQQGSVESAVNIPLPLLRKNLHKLNKDIAYICKCDGGKRSELAAFILNKGGFEAFIFKED
jgi:CRP-like cAMP-binding protein